MVAFARDVTADTHSCFLAECLALSTRQTGQAQAVTVWTNCTKVTILGATLANLHATSKNGLTDLL